MARRAQNRRLPRAATTAAVVLAISCLPLTAVAATNGVPPGSGAQSSVPAASTYSSQEIIDAVLKKNPVYNRHYGSVVGEPVVRNGMIIQNLAYGVIVYNPRTGQVGTFESVSPEKFVSQLLAANLEVTAKFGTAVGEPTVEGYVVTQKLAKGVLTYDRNAGQLNVTPTKTPAETINDLLAANPHVTQKYGTPVGEPAVDGDVITQELTGGLLTYDQKTKQPEVVRMKTPAEIISQLLAANPEVTEAYGSPVGDPTVDGDSITQKLTKGVVTFDKKTWQPNVTRTRTPAEVIGKLIDANPEIAKRIGQPVGDPKVDGDVITQNFSYGVLTYDQKTGKVDQATASTPAATIHRLLAANPEVTEAYGTPVGEPTVDGDVITQELTNGVLTFDQKTGQPNVTKRVSPAEAISAALKKHPDLNQKYGGVVGEPEVRNGLIIQRLAYGVITYNPKTGQTGIHEDQTPENFISQLLAANPGLAETYGATVGAPVVEGYVITQKFARGVVTYDLNTREISGTPVKTPAETIDALLSANPDNAVRLGDKVGEPVVDGDVITQEFAHVLLTYNTSTKQASASWKATVGQ